MNIDRDRHNPLPLTVLLGDSIRMGYQDEVKRLLAGKAETWFPEENCQDTPFMLKKLDQWLGGKKPDVIHVNCGLHDIFLDDGEHTRRPIDVYAVNLRQVLQKIRTLCPDSTVIFALTTPVDETKQPSSKTYARLVRRNRDVEEINTVAVAAVRDAGMKLNDLYSTTVRNGVGDMLIDDGIHLNKRAAGILGEQVARHIETTLPIRKK